MAIIDKPSDYFNTKIYTGNSGSQTLSMANIGLAWFKSRGDSGGQLLFDIMRGGNGTNNQEPILKSNASTKDQGSDITAAGGLVFGSSSTSVGTDNGGYNYNQNGKSYVNWHWQAGTSFTNDASATGIGTIDSAGSANTTSGFSIVSYTGTGSAGTIKHGLSTAPKMIIQKNRDETQPWWTYVESIGAGGQLRLSGTNAAGSDGGVLWNSTAPTSSVFSVGDNTGTNGSADKCIAYCFAEKQGYSKFGSYTGNGNADGTFVYTGFKPAMIIIKQTNEARDWLIIDNKRLGYNVKNYDLHPNLTAAEDTRERLDIVSNGFKMRDASNANNKSGGSYIYMAFAENPFVTSTDNGSIPATAR